MLLSLFLTFVHCPAQEPEATAPARLDLLPHAELSAALHALADAHPNLAELHLVGRSRAGLAIEALALAGPGGDLGAKERPAILLVANLEGPRLFTSAVALHHARGLIEGYTSDAKKKAFLDGVTLWIVPRANPDAAEARFASPREERRASGPGVDDDRDGRNGEDPPADLDGDNLVTWIREEDPDGEWIQDPTDARVLIKADRTKGQRGVYRLWPEGRDLDGDEKVAEDAPLDARLDRNFAGGWQQHAADAGAFPTSEPETRALIDFVLAHPEIALVVTYDAFDDLVGDVKSVADDAPAVKRVPPEGVLESDAKLLKEIAKRYRDTTGSKAKGESSDAGTFQRWCYEQRGLLTLNASLWEVPIEEEKKAEKEEGKEGAAAGEKGAGEEGAAAEEPKAEGAPPAPAEEAVESEEPEAGAEEGEGEKEGMKEGDEKKEEGKKDEEKPSDDAKRLRWMDETGESWRFVPWTSFAHPELGTVEIGGFAPFAKLEPPESERAEIAEKHLEFLVGLGEIVPRVQVAELERERLSEGVFRVKAVVENDALLPLFTRSALRARAVRPAKVTLVLPEAGHLLSGQAQQLLSELAGSGGRQEFTWLVQGPDEVEIGVEVDSEHAGRAFKKTEVVR